jgi:hypothetical protein
VSHALLCRRRRRGLMPCLCFDQLRQLSMVNELDMRPD